MIAFEEAALAWAKLLMRAELAEAKVKELEEQIAKKEPDVTPKGT